MANISIDRRYWFEDSVARAWPPGRDVFTGENNPKANYALDLNIDGQVMTFIPDSVINNGVYNPFGEVSKGRIYADKSYYLPWFLDPKNQEELAKVGSKIDLSKSDVASYIKDQMGASTDGVLIPKGSLAFDSIITDAPGKVKGIGNINGQNVYLNEDVNKTGRTYFTDPAGQTREYIPPSGGGGFLGGLLGGLGDIGEGVLGGIKDFGGNIDQAVRETVPGGWTTAALLAAGYYGPEAAGGAGLTGTDAALADLAASTPAFTGAEAAGAGLLSGAAAAPELTAAQAAEMIAAEQAGSMTAAETLAAIQAEQAAAGVAGAGAAAGAAGAGAAGAGALTAAELGKLGLIQGGLGLAGGLLQGESAKGAAETLAAQQAALAEKTLQMGKFQPVGVTTRFGTSAFKTDPVTGAITPSYTLSPEAQAYQDALAKMGTQSLTAGQGLMNLGQQYIGESPEAVRQRYMETQLATLAPSQAQTLAEIRNRLQQTGRGGFATGATAPEAGGLMATSPELAAYYNSLADTQRKLAAQAEQQYQSQVQFGQGLLTGATKPFEGVFGAQRTVETAGQQPLGLSTDFANLVAQRGADQARNYATAMGASYQTQAGANAYNPFATAFQGASSNPLTAYGLSRLIG